MSFNSRKIEVCQQVCTIAEIEFDKCRHTTSQSVLDGTITTSTSVDSSQLISLSITGGNANSFENSDPYILWDSEIIKVDVDSNSQLTITGRGQFGTVATSHTSGSIKLMHSGEADGTCYGFPQTCSSGDSYQAGLATPFLFPDTQLDVSKIFYTGFKSWSHSPVKVDPGQSIGKRASVTVTISDSQDNDIYVPYKERRTNKATLFSKLLARHPNIEGRVLRIRTGFNPTQYDESNFITREYIIDTATLNKGVFSVNAKDPLILTENKKAKAPLASKGRLIADMDETATQVIYKDDVDLAYGSSGTVLVRIDSEIIECTVNGTNVLDIVTRGYGGTEAKDHKGNATVQKCLTYTGENVVDIIEDLITDYTTTNANYLDDYSGVKASTSAINLTAVISKPTEVQKLLNELVKCGDLTMYYDEENQKIRIKPVTDSSAGLISINEELHIKQDSPVITRKPDDQITRYSTAWALNDLTKETDEENFSIVYQAINAELESAVNKGEVNEADIFFNRWLTNSDLDVTIGTSIAQRVIDRSDELPEEATFIIDAESVLETQGSRFELGTVFTLETSKAVEVDGSNKARNHQVLSIKDLGNLSYRVLSRLFQDPALSLTADFIVDSNKEHYDLSEDFAPSAGHYVVVIERGVTIGSADTSIPAMTTGSQATGVTFEILILGSILGMGGAGGDGGYVPEIFGEVDKGKVGLVGGDAFHATVDCTIKVGSGALWAGGGGAGGGESSIDGTESKPIERAGNGGSGGQGYGISLGGDAGTAGSRTGIGGNEGNRTTEGALGGIRGGSFGESGDKDGNNGGLAGYAIVSNGYNVTIANGNNNLNIKGRRS